MGRSFWDRKEPFGAMSCQRQTRSWFASRPQSSRHARVDSSHLGRRVRTDSDERKRGWKGSQPLWLYHVDGGRWRQEGVTIGSTDEIGLHAVEDRLHIHDLHATILHLIGLDAVKLVYSHQVDRNGSLKTKGKSAKSCWLRERGVDFTQVTSAGSRSSFI